MKQDNMATDELKVYTIPDQTAPITEADIQAMIASQFSVQNVGQMKLSSGTYQSANFVKGSTGWQLLPNGNLEASNGNFRGDITGATGTFSGTVTVGSLNIPDSTTANSMHVDSSGNTWWGSNVASGSTSANAAILATGVATFKNILIGGASIQYQVTNAGIFSFGDGSDGAGVADGSTALAGASLAANVYTLTRDVYFATLTISTGVTIKPSGYRIFGTGTLTFNGTAAITGDGVAGSAGTTGIAPNNGAGGTALADGYLKGSLAGGAGGSGHTGGGDVGVNGVGTSNSIGSNGSNGGNGQGNSGGTGGTATVSNVKLIANWHLATLLDISSSGSTVKFDNSASSGGGGGGTGNGVTTGAGGGGAGSGGRILAVYFRVIVIGASATLTANGGIGGAGGNGSASGQGSGGGGGGGNGGQIILVYNTISNSGMLAASGGTGGAKGTGGTGDGVAGVNGSAGTIRQFQVSL